MIQNIQTSPEAAGGASAAGSAADAPAHAGNPHTISQRVHRLAGHAHSLLGLVAALTVTTGAGWPVAIVTGLLTCGVIHALRRDAPGWPLEELAAGLVLCLALMLVPWLYAVHAQSLWLHTAPLVIGGILLLLWLLTQRNMAATITGRAMLAAVPPLATLMHVLG